MLLSDIFLKTEKGSTSQGTGFYFVAGGAMYLVTAKHVVEIGLSPDGATDTIPNSDMELLSYSNDAQTRIVMLANLLLTLRQNGDVKQNDSRDAVVIKIGVMAGGDAPRVIYSSGVSLKEGGENTPIVGLPMSMAIKFNEVLVGNDAVIFGYPASLSIRGTPSLIPSTTAAQGLSSGAQSSDKFNNNRWAGISRKHRRSSVSDRQ